MTEYTIKDVIIDPEDPKIEGVVGKLVYMGNNPRDLVYRANNGIKARILTDIVSSYDMPFKSNEFCFPCIIVKKEDPKPEYVPFSSADEFIVNYMKNFSKRRSNNELQAIDDFGMWLNDDIADNSCIAVVHISDEGINDGDLFADWDNLLKYYTFLDGTPCGKLKEE